MGKNRNKKYKYVEKKRYIREKVRTLVLAISMTGMGLAMAIGLFGMLMIKDKAVKSSRELGTQAMDVSETALLEQMENSLITYTQNKVKLANNQLLVYINYVGDFAALLTDIYANTDQYRPRKIAAPSAGNAGLYTLQRYHEEKVDPEDVQVELGLLAHVEPLWNSVIMKHSDMINSIYLGTVNGGMLAYDNQSELAENDIFDVRSTAWFQKVQETEEICYMESYVDSYGRGLVISCYAPFYNSSGNFAGVVGIDILMDDLNQEIISTDISSGSYAVLIDESFRVIAMQGMRAETKQYTFEYLDDMLGIKISEQLDKIEEGKVQLLRQQEYYYTYGKIGLSNWGYMVIVPVSDIIQPVEVISKTINTHTVMAENAVSQVIFTVIAIFIGVIIIGVFLISLFSLKFALRITNPIEQLKRDVRIISDGNLKHHARITSNDEIEDLAENFNHMSASLMKYIHDFTEVTKEKERIGAELSIATQIQADMLPRIFPFEPDRPEFDLFAAMDPAKEVGGDFYDYFMVDDDRLAIVIGDVSGKGIPASLFMVISKTIIKNYVMAKLPPDEVLTKANMELCEGNDTEMFTTAWLGIYEISTGKLYFSDAGHDTPIKRKRDGSIEYIKPIKKKLMLAGMEGTSYILNESRLERGELLLIYTDGVPEATNIENELFGQERLEKSVREHKNKEPKELIGLIRKDVDAFVGEAPQFDDLTMLALEITDQLRRDYVK